MAIVRVNKDRYTVDSLYQYDYNQDLVIYGLSLPSIPEIHFANSVVKEALVKQATLDNAGVVRVDIPNEILTYPHNIDVYVGVYEGDAFRVWYSFTIPVKPKKKPAEFITPDDETVHSFNALENQILNIERQNASFKSTITSAWNTFKSNVESTVTSLKASFNEKVLELTNSFNDLKTSFSTYKNSVDTEVTQLKSDFNEYKGKTDVLESRPVNNNILINSNFANPVNQRGITAETWVDGEYGIDRWRIANRFTKCSSINDEGLTFYTTDTTHIYNAILVQRVDASDVTIGETYTLTTYINDALHSTTFVLQATTHQKWINIYGVALEVDASNIASGYIEVRIRSRETTPLTVKWMKLELGDHATPYVPRLYAEELALCKRYYQKYNRYSSRTTGYRTPDVRYFYATFRYSEMRVYPSVKSGTIYLNNVGDSDRIELTKDGHYALGNGYIQFSGYTNNLNKTDGTVDIYDIELDAEL